MSSYYQSFSYIAPNGKRYNSFKDKNLIVTHFESGDSGEVDTFLGMDAVYTDNAYGTRRLDFGAKYNSVAKIKISVMKADGTDFTVSEVRDFLRWTTGSRKVSYLDLSDIVQNGDDLEEIVQVQFLGRIIAVYQQKLDARTIGFVIEHESISPYAYSPIQYATCSFGQALSINNGVLMKDDQSLYISTDGVLSNVSNTMLNLTNDGVAFIDNSIYVQINNETDDLSSYVYIDTKFTSNNSDYLIIKNRELYEESAGIDGITEITGMSKGEIITLHSNQFVSSSSGRLLGNDFNFIWPKLIPGSNTLVVGGSGEGVVEFSWRYPVKIGDCAINIETFGGGICGGCSSNNTGTGTISGPVTWNDILGKPTTIKGYGIVDAYTTSEVDNKLNNINVKIDENELNEMLKDVFE